MRANDYCIILAGGVGRRLWPASREQHPKQFIDFFGVGKTLLQLTFERFAAFLPIENIYISTFADYVGLVREQLPQISDAQILAEPVQLSTGPAAAWASWSLARKHPDACFVATPADQFITGDASFTREIVQGLDYVRHSDHFLAMSVKANSPVTAFGYIQKGEQLDEHRRTVKSFTEKPPIEFARTFIESGEFLWNTGLFLWKASTMQEEFAHLFPVIAQTDASHLANADEEALLKRCFPMAEFCTLDSIILERRQDTVVQECTFGWRDVGSWPVMKETLPGNVDGNVTIGGAGVIFQGTKNTLVCLPETMGAVVRGLDNYLVVLEGNMLVIMPNNDASIPRRLASEVHVRLGEDFL